MPQCSADREQKGQRQDRDATHRNIITEKQVDPNTGSHCQYWHTEAILIWKSSNSPSEVEGV